MLSKTKFTEYPELLERLKQIRLIMNKVDDKNPLKGVELVGNITSQIDQLQENIIPWAFNIYRGEQEQLMNEMLTRTSNEDKIKLNIALSTFGIGTFMVQSGVWEVPTGLAFGP